VVPETTSKFVNDDRLLHHRVARATSRQGPRPRTKQVRKFIFAHLGTGTAFVCCWIEREVSKCSRRNNSHRRKRHPTSRAAPDAAANSSFALSMIRRRAVLSSSPVAAPASTSSGRARCQAELLPSAQESCRATDFTTRTSLLVFPEIERPRMSAPRRGYFSRPKLSASAFFFHAFAGPASSSRTQVNRRHCSTPYSRLKPLRPLPRS
jgi:hypothetical protein